MEKRYIISRYRAAKEKDVEFNRKVARYFCLKTLYEGKIPIAPHLYFTQFLNDDIEGDRQRGINIGLEVLRCCEEYLVIVIDNEISEGMKREIEEAGRLNMNGNVISLTKKQMAMLMKVAR